MPILRTRHEVKEGLSRVDYMGEKVVLTHVEEISPIAEQCKDLRKQGNNGFSKKRGFRLIARIPSLAFFEKKELTNPDGTVNEKEIKKYLNSPDGEMFKTVERGI